MVQIILLFLSSGVFVLTSCCIAEKRRKALVRQGVVDANWKDRICLARLSFHERSLQASACLGPVSFLLLPPASKLICETTIHRERRESPQKVMDACTMQKALHRLFTGSSACGTLRFSVVPQPLQIQLKSNSGWGNTSSANKLPKNIVLCCSPFLEDVNDSR